MSAAHLRGPPIAGSSLLSHIGAPHFIGCTGKRRYDSYGVAQTAVSYRSRMRLAPHIYGCPHCRGWHTTSTPERQP